MLTIVDVEAASPKDEKPAEDLGRLDAKLNKALKKAHDIRSLGAALLHVLGDAKDRDYEPPTTADCNRRHTRGAGRETRPSNRQTLP